MAISASPYQFRDPSTIPPMPWLFGSELQRGLLSVNIAPPGTGKTTYDVGCGLSMVTNKPLMGKSVFEGPLRVWLINLEDGREHLQRQIQAACKHWGLQEGDLGGRLFLDSALDGLDLKLATQTAAGGVIINRALVDAWIEEVKLAALMLSWSTRWSVHIWSTKTIMARSIWSPNSASRGWRTKRGAGSASLIIPGS
jgi:hypothetical protein